TLSSARNLIMAGRLRYHREALDIPASLSYARKRCIDVRLLNLSRGGVGIHCPCDVPTTGPGRLSFSLPGPKAVVKVGGQIEWIDRQGNAGIRFVQMGSRIQRDLQLWLEKRYFRTQV